MEEKLSNLKSFLQDVSDSAYSFSSLNSKFETNPTSYETHFASVIRARSTELSALLNDIAIEEIKKLKKEYTGQGKDWIPKVNKDGSTSYIKEDKDNAKTLESQFGGEGGITEGQANDLYKTMENGEISGQNVKDVTESAKMKLNLKSKLATSDRILQQFVFANDFSKTEGADKWSVQQYYTGWKGKNQTPVVIRGNVIINGEIVEMAIPFIWHTSKGNFFTKKMPLNPAVYSNSLWGITSFDKGTMMTGQMGEFSSINVYVGYHFEGNPIHISTNGGMTLGVFRKNEKKMLKYLSRTIPNFRYKNNIKLNNTQN